MPVYPKQDPKVQAANQVSRKPLQVGGPSAPPPTMTPAFGGGLVGGPAEKGAPDIKQAIGNLQAQLGAAPGAPTVMPPAQAAVRKRLGLSPTGLPPRLQQQVDAGRMTQAGAANRFGMFGRGELPGQQLPMQTKPMPLPAPMPMTPTVEPPVGDTMRAQPIDGSFGAVDGGGYQAMPMEGGFGSIAPPGVMTPGFQLGPAGGGFGAIGKVDGGGLGLDFATGGGLRGSGGAGVAGGSGAGTPSLTPAIGPGIQAGQSPGVPGGGPGGVGDLYKQLIKARMGGLGTANPMAVPNQIAR